MKKFIALAVALVSFGAMAQENRHMVTIEGWDQTQADRSLDLSWSSDDADQEEETQNIALNYAYAINGSWQVGALYKNFKAETDGDVLAANRGYTTLGIFGIYNFAGKLHDTNYLALRYEMQEFEESDDTENDDDEVNTWTLEFGHRFSLGTLWGMNFNWSPSVEVSKSTFEPAASGADEVDTDALALNVIKFDVLF